MLVTDQTIPGASALAESRVWVMGDHLWLKPNLYHHQPQGINVLYMDGHVEFQPYSAYGPAPANASVAAFLSQYPAAF